MNRIPHLVYTALILAFLLGCKEKEAVSANGSDRDDLTITVSREQFEAGGMKLGKITTKSFPQTIQATGMIDVPPENKAVVSAFFGGYVKETPLLVGDIVKKGQVLLTIENPEFITLQQNYLEAKQQLTFLQAEYERQQQLLAENISSQKSFLRAESDYKSKLASYNGLKQKLGMLNFSIQQVEGGEIRSVSNIYAPIDGSITKMNISKGMFVAPSDEILEITNNDHIHLELRVFEKDIMKLRKGQPIQFTIPEASGESYEAEVYLIGTNIEANRTVKVHGELKEDDHHHFLTGMFVDAGIISAQSEKQALPSMALAELDNTFYALKLVSETNEVYVFEKTPVTPGEQFDGFTALEGLGTTDTESQFLIRGVFSLLTE